MSQTEVLTSEKYETWKFLVSALELTALNAEDSWTLQTESAEWEFGPYLQVCFKDDRTEMQVEITSNKFLDPPMPGFDAHLMKELGWLPPKNEDFPNWHMYLPFNEQSCAHIARVWVRVLLDCYNMNEYWRFCPAPMTPTVVKPWIDFMVKRSGVCLFSLIDRQGRNREEIAEFVKAAQKRERNENRMRANQYHCFEQIKDVLYRAERLGITGMDIVELAGKMYDRPVVVSINDMVINGALESPVFLTWERLAQLGINRRSEVEDWKTA